MLRSRTISLRLLKYPKKHFQILQFSRHQCARFSTVLQAPQTTSEKTFFQKTFMNAEQQHERLPIEIFTLIRKISVIKDLDYSKYPQQHPRDDGPEIIKTETGLKFVLKENLDFNASFDFEDIATCDEMIKNGNAALIDVPEVHMPRFLFLVALRSRILVFPIIVTNHSSRTSNL